MAFDLVTVNWNQAQTNLWLRHVEKHCPGANVILVGESDLKELCWSCPKIGCLLAEFEHPDRVIYMDTDTIVFADLEELFDLMPKGRRIGVTRYCTFPSCPRHNEQRFPQKGTSKRQFEKHSRRYGITAETYRHYSSGLLMFRDFEAAGLGADWIDACRYFREQQVYKQHKLFEELALSFLLSGFYRELVWEMPGWVHTNVLNHHKEMKPEWTFVLHYHKTRRLVNIGKGHLLSDE